MNADFSHGVVGKPDGLSVDAQSLRQFGVAEPGLTYPIRAGAHGILMSDQGLIALVRIGEAKGYLEHDLPGGGVDAGESEQDALAREFMEETGLRVRAGRLVARAGQYWRKDNVTPRNSQFAIYETFIAGPAGAPSEPNHVLVWATPQEALARVRHEAHAWAIERYLEKS